MNVVLDVECLCQWKITSPLTMSKSSHGIIVNFNHSNHTVITRGDVLFSNSSGEKVLSYCQRHHVRREREGQVENEIKMMKMLTRPQPKMSKKMKRR